MPTVLSASPLHRVVHHPHPDGPTERLVVTFAPKTDALADEGFGTRLALKRGHDTVYVGSHRNTYHQGIGLKELVDLILPIAGGREVIAYGGSAGGYAALYFGGALNARILAIAPRNDLHPLCSTIPGRFKHLPNLEDVPTSSHQPVVFYDPKQPKDARLAHKWVRPAYPDADLRPVFGVGHNVIGGLSKANVLAPLATGFFKGIAPGPIQIWDRTSPHWHAGESYAAERRGDLQAALDHLVAAAAIEATMPVLQDVVRLANKVGDTSKAEDAARALCRMKNGRRAMKQAHRESFASIRPAGT